MHELSLIGDERSEETVVRVVTELCRAAGFGPTRIQEVRTALSEAFSNAVNHGNSGNQQLPVAMRAWPDGSGIVVEIHDQGTGLREIPPIPDLSAKISGRDRPRGWGVFLLRTFASEVTFVVKHPAGYLVRMRFDVEAPEVPTLPILIKERTT